MKKNYSIILSSNNYCYYFNFRPNNSSQFINWVDGLSGEKTESLAEAQNQFRLLAKYQSELSEEFQMGGKVKLIEEGKEEAEDCLLEEFTFPIA